MKGIVLVAADGRRFVCVPSGTTADFDAAQANGGWRARLMSRDSAGGVFGPAFDTEAEALALARSAAVALAEGTGGVFGEPRPLKVGDRVKYVEEGANFGDEGVVAAVYECGFDVKWDDEDGECAYEWWDIGVFVAKADAAPSAEATEAPA